MTCEEFNYNANLVFDNLGDAELSNEIQNHIRICYICSQEYSRLKNYFEKLNSNPKGIEVSEKYIQDTIDAILQNKILPVRETNDTPTEVKLRSNEVKQEHYPEPPVEPEFKKEEVENREIGQAVRKEVEIKTGVTEKKAPKKNAAVTVKQGKRSYDLYFFYGVIGVSCLIIVYIILQFFIH
jgi:CRISPR/Cas system-associated exonuclease Cas4 (RecB family)